MHDVTRGQNTVLDVALRMVELEVQALFLCGGAQHNRIAACTSQHHLRPSLHASAHAMLNPALHLRSWYPVSPVSADRCTAKTGQLQFVHLSFADPMDNTRGRKGVQLAPLKTTVTHWLATTGRVACDASNERPALVRAFRGVYVHYTEKQCSKALTVMLRGIRGIVRPENKNSLQELSAPTQP